jgi:hypothetical protein
MDGGGVTIVWFGGFFLIASGMEMDWWRQSKLSVKGRTK